MKSVLILTPILGVNWIFGLLAVNEKLTVFEFLFVIINSLQGLLIFIFHCVGSSEVSVMRKVNGCFQMEYIVDLHSKFCYACKCLKNAVDEYFSLSVFSIPSSIFDP